jgi:hypothetical protein
LLVNPDVILGHVPIGEPLLEFAVAARTTDLLNFPLRFYCVIDILDEKTCLSFNNNSGTESRWKTTLPRVVAIVIF